MKLTEQQLFDYMNCPALFEMKYVRGIEIEEPVSVSKLLDKVSKYFYINLLNGKICGTGDLKKKWDAICYQNSDYVDTKKNIEGIGLIFQMVQWASDERMVVLDIDSPYQLTFNNKEIGPIELAGNMGTILASGKDDYELLITDFSKKMPDPWVIDMRMKYTLDAYAFTQVYNKPLAGVRIRNVKNAKDFMTNRTADDFRRLESTVNSVGVALEKNIFYPRESFMCANCTAKEYCKAWN